MGTRPIIGALSAPILAATMLGLAPTAAVAATDTPYHPTVLWATSEEKVGESAPNGTIAALVEDPGSAQRVSRALKASGLVADVLRADAPVAGARVVG